MACLFALFAGIFPRLALFIVWVARPARVDAAFDTWIWPLLGLIFLPFATLIYVLLWTAGGLSTGDWIWVDPGRRFRHRALGRQAGRSAGRYRATRPGPDVARPVSTPRRAVWCRAGLVRQPASPPSRSSSAGRCSRWGRSSRRSASRASHGQRHLPGRRLLLQPRRLRRRSCSSPTRADSERAGSRLAWSSRPRQPRLAQRRGALRRHALLRRQPGRRVRRGPHTPAVQRLDLAARTSRGCVCFLCRATSRCSTWATGACGCLAHALGWWVAAVNQLGSVLFFLAGVAAFTRPATSTALDVGLVNWGTFAGAVCFAVGGVIQAFDSPTPTRTVVQQITMTRLQRDTRPKHSSATGS